MSVPDPRDKGPSWEKNSLLIRGTTENISTKSQKSNLLTFHACLTTTARVNRAFMSYYYYALLLRKVSSKELSLFRTEKSLKVKYALMLYDCFAAFEQLE